MVEQLQGLVTRVQSQNRLYESRSPCRYKPSVLHVSHQGLPQTNATRSVHGRSYMKSASHTCKAPYRSTRPLSSLSPPKPQSSVTIFLDPCLSRVIFYVVPLFANQHLNKTSNAQRKHSPWPFTFRYHGLLLALV